MISKNSVKETALYIQFCKLNRRRLKKREKKDQRVIVFSVFMFRSPLLVDKQDPCRSCKELLWRVAGEYHPPSHPSVDGKIAHDRRVT